MCVCVCVCVCVSFLFVCCCCFLLFSGKRVGGKTDKHTKDIYIYHYHGCFLFVLFVCLRQKDA